MPLREGYDSGFRHVTTEDGKFVVAPVNESKSKRDNAERDEEPKFRFIC
jgi:hypothetical protein